MTLVELVCCIAILGILAAICIPYVVGYIQDAKDVVAMINSATPTYVPISELGKDIPASPAPTVEPEHGNKGGNKGGNGNHYGWDNSKNKN